MASGKSLTIRLKNRRNKLQAELEELGNQIQDIHEAIHQISYASNNSFSREYTQQDFINIARTFVQDQPGPGQRKPGAETQDLINELLKRSRKAKQVISDLNKELEMDEHSISYSSSVADETFSNITINSCKRNTQDNNRRAQTYLSRDKLAGEYQFYQDLLQALHKRSKVKIEQHKNIKEEKARALEWAENRRQRNK